MNSESFNSKDHWNRRFETDWEEFRGREQSRFFARLALDNLPSWFTTLALSRRFRFCDWGCAQGDGTDVLAAIYGRESVSGIDFSEKAIELARINYPNLLFKMEDWLSEQKTTPCFDVVFSSNTLEHFQQPFEVLSRLADHADKFVVLLLPYREFERHQEHQYTFIAENIPFAPAPDFLLVHAQVVDASTARPSFWPGEQVVLIYVRRRWSASYGLALRDIQIWNQAAADELARLRQLNTTILARHADQEERIAQAAGELASRNALIEELRQAAAESSRKAAELQDAAAGMHSRIRQLTQAVSEGEARAAAWESLLEKVRCSLSWRLTRPFRFGFRTIRARRISDSDYRQLREGLRKVYRDLPVPERIRLSLRSFYFRTIGRRETTAPGNAPRSGSASATPPALPHLSQLQEDEDWFVWAVIDWNFRMQRPQHLSLALAAHGRRVFYVSNHFVDDANPGFRVESLDGNGRLFQIHLHAEGSPVIYSGPPSGNTPRQLRAGVGMLLDWTESRRIVSLVQHPFWLEIVRCMPNSKLVYDCMDQHGGFSNTDPALLELERELMQSADMVAATSGVLYDQAATQNRCCALIRNAGEYSHFASAPQNVFHDPEGRKVIGYAGAVAEWFDDELVEGLALALPDCLVVLVGADTCGAGKRLKRLENVRFLGEVPYESLPGYVHGFEVCILPFRLTTLTRATNPVKIYEYLSAGKPVVSVDLPEMHQFGDLVHVASDHADFLRCVEHVLSKGTDAELAVRQRAFAREQTWQHRATELIRHVSTLTDPSASVIVITYNNLELTNACLHSLETLSDYANLEVIVVDNASSDHTPKFLREWQAARHNRHIILNSDNRGFAAASNQGLQAARGEYLALMNNDVHVTWGWLRTMINHLRHDRSIGLIGPVTNNIGNEAKIDIRYADLSEMQVRAARFTREHMGITMPLRTAAFFCVVMPRTTYEKVGPLDEAYGQGFFEDDDFCRRVEQEGLRILCAEDVFVHHHLSASFNDVRHRERRLLFEQNRTRYEAKWGPWVPHVYRDR